MKRNGIAPRTQSTNGTPFFTATNRLTANTNNPISNARPKYLSAALFADRESFTSTPTKMTPISRANESSVIPMVAGAGGRENSRGNNASIPSQGENAARMMSEQIPATPR
ncbi:hypothetical protein D3C84_805390 [compost metagenome]